MELHPRWLPKKNWLSQKDKAQYLPLGFDNKGVKQTSPTTIL